MFIRSARSALITLAALTLASCLTGCISPERKMDELERVAKDWCMVVRASQVIPVYPLTEDLRPGDVFLTQTPIGDERRLYSSKGFLPLDNHITRLSFDDKLAEFYKGYQSTSGAFPQAGGSAWETMPRAAFPTYNFSISRSGGLNLALPVQGVPVGFNLLGAAAASGTVTISDAYTFGLDIQQANDKLDEWLARGINRSALARYGTPIDAPDDERVYLRVVSRVYATGAVNILMNDTRSGGADAKAGFELPLGLTSAEGQTTAQMYTDALAKLNAPLQAGAAGSNIGARVKVVAASSRSVSLVEDFPRPLVIGYLAFDRQILPGGTLGTPVVTLAKLAQLKQFAPAPTPFGSDANSDRLANWLRADPSNRQRLLDALAARGLADTQLTNFIRGAQFATIRAELVNQLGVP
jgi:hypothetical protein